MHNLAIALHNKGFEVTGSDDEIFEPSKSRLSAKGILPEMIGWFPEKITKDLEAVIVGMHARADNPELLKSQELGLPIFSYPEYLFEQTKNKKRIVIGGSHGKTTITAMILHVLKKCNIDADFMVGAQLAGFDCMVKLSDDALFAVLEGDEYLSSPVDRRPKFHLYHPDIALISGIAWDHINVFPTFENYVDQFRIFLDKVSPGGNVVFNQDDSKVAEIVNAHSGNFTKIPYSVHPHEVRNGVTYLKTAGGEQEVMIFGKHNLQNLSGAKACCMLAGVSDREFYQAMADFRGAAKRLELVWKGANAAMYKDFAHSPSKLKATTEALKQQFPDRSLIACMELHTFSSLNKTFLNEYAHALDLADEAMVYFNPHTLEHKKLEPLYASDIQIAFATPNLKVCTSSHDVVQWLQEKLSDNTNLLMMTSGNFDGLDFHQLALELFEKPLQQH